MTVSLLASLLAAAATVVVNVGAASQTAQVLKRRGDCDGVSVASAANIAVTCTAWTVYSIAAELTLSAVSSAIGAVLWTAITVIVATRRGLTELRWPAVLAVALTAAWVFYGSAGLGVALVADSVVIAVPQLLRLRHRQEGVSRTAWGTDWISAACWTTYGVVKADPVLVISQTVRLVLSTAILISLTRPGTNENDTTNNSWHPPADRGTRRDRRANIHNPATGT